MKFTITSNIEQVKQSLHDRVEAARVRIAEERLEHEVDTIRCDEHLESRVKTVWEQPLRASFVIAPCCDAFKARADDALKELGARPKIEEVPVEAPESKHQQAFISYSHADHDRIAKPLYEYLLARGIKPWLDARDLPLGGNIVAGIFEDGIASSSAMIAIVSENSKDSTWCKEETTYGFLQKIKGRIKTYIPIVLDGVDIPTLFENTKCRVLGDIAELERAANEIADAILDVQPAVPAPLPPYAGTPVHRLSSLESIDEQILAASCRQILDANWYQPVVGIPQIRAWAETQGISRERFVEAIAVLEHAGYIGNVLPAFGQDCPSAAVITYYGMEQYLTNYESETYRVEKKRIVDAVLIRQAVQSMSLYMGLQIREAIVIHVLTGLDRGGHVVGNKHSGGMSVHATPTLSRLARTLEQEAQ
jgi:hypothetical protein